MEQSSMLQLILFTLPFMLLLSYLIFKRFPSPKKYPPGPIAWPLIGNTALSITESQVHLKICDLVKKHGHVMMLKFGVVPPMVVVSTPETAAIVLKKQDRICSGRSVPHSVKVPGYFEHTMVWADCTEHWKVVRKIFRTEMFSNKMVEAQTSIREEKVRELVRFLRERELGEVVQVNEVIFGCIINVLGAIIFSQNVYDYEGKIDNEKGMKGIIRQLMVLAAAPNLPDFYPIFGPLDLQRYRKITTDYVKKINDYWAGIVKERRATKDHSKNDFLDEIFGPGSDTSSCTIEWAMSELIRNPDKLVKLQEELDKFIGHSREVRESDLENLPYLHACIKETLRLHPPVTFMLPHRTTEEFQLMNYTVPKDSQMLVNMYAIHRDPKLWDDPLSFKPERFLNSPVDYQGNDFQYLPFGSGRRICPAINMASRSNRFLLASLVHNFEWSLPDGMKPSELDMHGHDHACSPYNHIKQVQVLGKCEEFHQAALHHVVVNGDRSVHLQKKDEFDGNYELREFGRQEVERLERKRERLRVRLGHVFINN
ncbi:hypothetical protein Scep_005122 [Stephania cephalantha]|uniref:Cytochrome P450 n=1 Tax=Stephania cephalantha TaxID=152367 RepID=A0AAP0KTP8_9MAGN